MVDAADMPQDAFLCCLVVTEESVAFVVPGSTQAVCELCGQRVWVSKSGQAMMVDPEWSVHIKCMDCANKDFDSAFEQPDSPMPEVRIVKGGLDEIRALQEWEP